MTVLQLALIFLIVMDPIGSAPMIIALLKGHTIREQQKILVRELIFALLLMFVFILFGKPFINNLHVNNYTLIISGGILIFIISLNMLFNYHYKVKKETLKRDHVFVPIATPLLAGPALLALIMLYTEQEGILKVFLAIFFAWLTTGLCLLASPYLQLILGDKGLSALEQLMGMLLLMIGIEILVRGFSLFLTAIPTT